jgi:hypothetical protein
MSYLKINVILQLLLLMILLSNPKKIEINIINFIISIQYGC